jgi:hypothetical protein
VARLAMVGDRIWEHGMNLFCRPFTCAEVRYFDCHDRDGARSWLRAD